MRMPRWQPNIFCWPKTKYIRTVRTVPRTKQVHVFTPRREGRITTKRRKKRGWRVAVVAANAVNWGAAPVEGFWLLTARKKINDRLGRVHNPESVVIFCVTESGVAIIVLVASPCPRNG
jgi:hypothetical protein